MGLFTRDRVQKPEILGAKRLLLAKPVYADQDRLDPKDPGSMAGEHEGVPREVAVKALHDLGELSLLDPDSAVRSAKLVAIAQSIYPGPGDTLVNQ